MSLDSYISQRSQPKLNSYVNFFFIFFFLDFGNGVTCNFMFTNQFKRWSHILRISNSACKTSSRPVKQNSVQNAMANTRQSTKLFYCCASNKEISNLLTPYISISCILTPVLRTLAHTLSAIFMELESSFWNEAIQKSLPVWLHNHNFGSRLIFSETETLIILKQSLLCLNLFSYHALYHFCLRCWGNTVSLVR